MTPTSSTCLNCGNKFKGEFCNQCGEKVYSEHDKTLRHFVDETFHFITHLDGKFLKSLKCVFFKPGLLSYEYCSGIRKKYFKPVSLFLVGVIIYLLAPPIQGLNMSHEQTVFNFSGIYINIPENMSVNKAAKRKITMEELAKQYDAKSPKVAKILLLIILPITAGILWLLFFRKRAYMFDHLIMSTEMNTLFLYSVFLIIPFLLKIVDKILFLFGVGFDFGDSVMFPIQLVILGAGWGVAFHRFYKIGIWQTILKTFVFFILHSILLYVVYRLILFIVVMLLL